MVSGCCNSIMTTVPAFSILLRLNFAIRLTTDYKNMLNHCIGKLKAHIAKHGKLRRLISFCGIELDLCSWTPMHARVLETIVFPYFIQRDEFYRVLFVGCDWYTRAYNRMFQNKAYSTMDINPSQSKYGAKHHIVDSAANVHLHFNEDTLDLIICNGVFGWGLDARADVERAFQGCFECLREGGVLVLGWNDISKRRPFFLEECQSLQLFNQYVFPPLLHRSI